MQDVTIVGQSCEGAGRISWSKIRWVSVYLEGVDTITNMSCVYICIHIFIYLNVTHIRD